MRWPRRALPVRQPARERGQQPARERERGQQPARERGRGQRVQLLRAGAGLVRPFLEVLARQRALAAARTAHRVVAHAAARVAHEPMARSRPAAPRWRELPRVAVRWQLAVPESGPA
jgi:hypothetical protein